MKFLIFLSVLFMLFASPAAAQLCYVPTGVSYTVRYLAGPGTTEICLYGDTQPAAELDDPALAIICEVPTSTDSVTPNSWSFDVIPAPVADFGIVAVGCTTFDDDGVSVRLCSGPSNIALIKARPAPPVLID